MSFSAFSKEFTANMFTAVENQFILRYLPQANGDAVRVYLYGLYLCSCKEEFDGETCAKILKIPYSELVEIYDFWEECDLVRVLSRDPLFVEYLPVSSAVGKPKTVRPEKYAEFNRELLRLLSKAGKDFKPYEMQRILEFLENNPMEPQAFLLVAEYCSKKDGEKLSSAHMLNKAKKLCGDHKYTYEQVERELADFNAHEHVLAKIFALLGIYRKPQDGDYDFLGKWTDWGMETGAVYECARTLKKGSLPSLDLLVAELHERGVQSEQDAKEYLARREELTATVFQVARKLGVKVNNPRAYIEEYAERWQEHGYDCESLLPLASLCFRLGYGFAEMDAALQTLYAEGVVDATGIRNYCAAREKQLKVLQSVQNVCGVVKKTRSALDMVAAWQSWNFSDAMILEAAKRSAGAASPLPYINKLLSEWKRTGVFSPGAIPEKTPLKTDYKSEAAIAADQRNEREHFYATRRSAAVAKAERAKARAEKDDAFRAAETGIKKGEIELAKAEVFSPETVPAVKERLKRLSEERAAALSRLGISEEDFLPKYACAKCSDTGFLPDGRMCDCYRGRE